jgi:hypothetical protein
MYSLCLSRCCALLCRDGRCHCLPLSPFSVQSTQPPNSTTSTSKHRPAPPNFTKSLCNTRSRPVPASSALPANPSTPRSTNPPWTLAQHAANTCAGLHHIISSKINTQPPAAALHRQQHGELIYCPSHSTAFGKTRNVHDIDGIPPPVPPASHRMSYPLAPAKRSTRRKHSYPARTQHNTMQYVLSASYDDERVHTHTHIRILQTPDHRRVTYPKDPTSINSRGLNRHGDTDHVLHAAVCKTLFFSFFPFGPAEKEPVGRPEGWREAARERTCLTKPQHVARLFSAAGHPPAALGSVGFTEYVLVRFGTSRQQVSRVGRSISQSVNQPDGCMAFIFHPSARSQDMSGDMVLDCVCRVVPCVLCLSGDTQQTPGGGEEARRVRLGWYSGRVSKLHRTSSSSASAAAAQQSLPRCLAVKMRVFDGRNCRTAGGETDAAGGSR